MGAHSAGQPGYQGDRSTGPDELEAGPLIHTRRLPGWVVPLIGIVLAVAAVVGGGYLALRYNRSQPDVVITVGPSRTPWALVPPLSMADYSRDPNAATEPSANPTSKKQIISATYSRGGQAAAVLLLTRPETDAKKFMADMSMNAVVAQGDGYCGTSIDSNHEGCAVIRDNTAVMVVDLVGSSRAELMELTTNFADTLSA